MLLVRYSLRLVQGDMIGGTKLVFRTLSVILVSFPPHVQSYARSALAYFGAVLILAYFFYTDFLVAFFTEFVDTIITCARG